MVAMDAEPFYGTDPLRFRGIPDSLADLHLEGSECCLIHADNPLSATQGVFLNANVRVGYNVEAYETVNAFLTWPSPFQRIKGAWMVRFAKPFALWRYATENLVIDRRLKQWRALKGPNGERHDEKGGHCLINEMQVLVENGWKHL